MLGCWISNNSVIAVFISELQFVFRDCLDVDAPLHELNLMHDFEQPGSPHSTADAHRHDGISGFPPPPFDQRMTRQPGAGHAVGVADRDRTAVDIEFLRIDPEFIAAVDDLHRKGFVELPEIDIIDIKTMTLEQTRDREYRPDAHLVRLAARRNEATKDTKRLQALLGGELVAHDDGGACAVGKLARVAPGDGVAGALGRLDL